MRIALVHDWLTGMRGGERVLAEFIRIYPEADIITLIHCPGATTPEIDERVRGTSWLQKIPGIRRWYRHFLPLYPSAVRSLRLTGYDLVISLSHAAVKNVSIPRGTVHLCYCFTPMRYIWDQQDTYFGAWGRLATPLFERLRRWDVVGSQGVTNFAAISHLVAARIRRFYARRSTVIYPPVATDWIELAEPGRQGEAFLYAGALVPYKRPDLVVEAFNRTGDPLWVVGSGSLLKELKRRAAPNVSFLGALTDGELSEVYRRSRALIFPGKEDFGIIPVESMAAGRPVIGAYSGGLKETVRGVKLWSRIRSLPRESSGVWYRAGDAGELDALISAIRYFKEHEGEFSPEVCRAHASLFSPTRFRLAWGDFVSSVTDPERQPETGRRYQAALPTGPELGRQS